MNLALLDINKDNLAAATSALSDSNSDTTTKSYPLDVSSLSAWQSLSTQLSTDFPSIDLLMLNAGHGPKPKTSSPWFDTEYFHSTLNTNLYGVIYGLSTFLPLIQKSPGPSAVIITGSKQGITNPPGNPAYNASKSAVKTLAEHLAHDLRSEGNAIYSPHVSVHLLVPGWTYTGLSGNPGPKGAKTEDTQDRRPKGAWSPQQCAEYGFKKIQEGKFYVICPDNDVDEALDQARMSWGLGDVVEGRKPLSRWEEGTKGEAAKWIKGEAGRRRGA
jgi:NAD(P)-dependent dehydrogenase (short-subunit alcohol dehydrogenase family)